MPPPAAPNVFDRALVRARLTRAGTEGREHFLLDRAAEDVVARLSAVKRVFGHVLDLGAARPTVAFALRQALPEAFIVRAAPVAERPGAWSSLVADEEAQPFAAESFDLVVSMLALHAANDLPGALVQIRRALKPDGLFLGCLLGGQTLHELRHALAVAEAGVSGGTSPRVAPFADLRDLGGLLQRAGFALPVTDSEPLVVRYRDVLGLFGDLRAMGATNALSLRRRRPMTRALLARAAQVYAEQFSDADGRLRATFDVVWLSGWAPHDSQQRPLKPGSAKMSLEAALKGATGNSHPRRDD